MKRLLIFLPVFLLVTACRPSTEEIAFQAQEETTANVVSSIETSTFTPFPSVVPTNKLQPTPTEEPTIIPTLTTIPTPDGSPSSNLIDGAIYVYIPAGEFQMGTDDQQRFQICEQFSIECQLFRENETPEHTVYLDAYWIGQMEVTNQQFSDFLNENGNQSEGGRNWLNTDITWIAHINQSGGEWQADPGYADHPAVGVSWYGAAAYCQWVGGQLPTEAQWEKAARGDLEGKIFPWGNEVIAGQANFCDENCTMCAEECTDDSIEVSNNDGYEQTAPVGSFAPNGYGLFDMAGNVSEWVADWEGVDYYNNSPIENPQGPEDGIVRVLRGGTWGDAPTRLRVAFRGSHLPVVQTNGVGFRCTLSQQP